MATGYQVGQMQEFDPETETISSYIERLEMFFTANDIAEAKQVSVLLTVVGKTTFSLLRNLLSPDLPKDKAYKDLVAALKGHFEPKPLVIAERFNFYQRRQQPSESINVFVAGLRRLSTKCEFEAFLDQALRDRFVCGIRSESVQKKLLTEDHKTLTFTKAVELAQSVEAAEEKTKEFKGSTPAIAPPVHRVASGPRRQPTRQVPVPTATPQKSCYRCGRSNHDEQACRFRRATCHSCGKVGHIASACRSRKAKPVPRNVSRNPNDRTKWVEVETTETEDLSLFTIGERANSQITVQVNANGKELAMELDTGAAVSLISLNTKNAFFPEVPLQQSRVNLRTYTGEQIEVKGEILVDVQYGQQAAEQLPLVVVKGEGPSLFGRNWLRHIQLNWSSIKAIRQHSLKTLQGLCNQYAEVFNDELGHIQNFTARLLVQEDARPKFCKARTVPYALKAAVEEELHRLERMGVIEKIPTSEWATPVVAVPKKDGTVRLCGDYKVTINQALDVDQYPLPVPEALFATLSGGQRFTTLDLSQAYQQLEMEQESRKYLTINTHLGLYQFTRLPYGVASAPAQFQKVMDTLLQGIPGVTCYLDDILVTGRTNDEHLANLEEVLSRLKQHGVRIKKSKCKFMANSVEYLGHKIDADGLHTTDGKLQAILQAPTPRNVTEVRSFIGLVNYYGKFIPNLATTLHPLNQLLHRDRRWHWSKECAKAFKAAKEGVASSSVLVHYNPTLPVKMAGDASAYGVGAVISHVMPDGSERPIAFASRTLTDSEKNYSQVEKEALSLVFGVKRFQNYLYGRQFTLVTDHKPLLAILGPKRGIPALAAARLQRWAIILSAYRYEIEFRPTNAHSNADGLSRLPLKEESMEGMSSEPSLFNISQIRSLPVTSSQLRRASTTDRILSKVISYTKRGWPSRFAEPLRPYWRRRDELTIESDCLLWGSRVVVPQKLREKLLEELHRDHSGMSRMKTIARSYMWWPGLDGEIEKLVRGCQSCQAVKNSPPSSPLQPWSWPVRPWKRVHLDFAGPVEGVMLLLAVDAHSKWPEIQIMSSTTALKTIEVLRMMFSRYGLPEQIVTDNGPQFVSTEFEMFMKENGVRHIRSAPYHPASNGLVERLVQTCKQGLKAGKDSGLPLSHRLSNFLITYRSTRHSTTGKSPSELFLQRNIRTRFDLLKPDVEREVLDKQAQQKLTHDRRSREAVWTVGQRVMAKNMGSGPNWIPATVTEVLGPVTYMVRIESGQVWKRHAEQLKTFVEQAQPQPASESTEGSEFPWVESPEGETEPEEQPEQNIPDSSEVASPSSENSTPTELVTPRYPTRDRHPPPRYM